MSQEEDNITRINPVYDFDKVACGYFEIYVDYDTKDPFKLSFVPFLDHQIRNNSELFDYLKKTSKDLTVSHAIYDLYDIGVPIEDWVREYVEIAKNATSAGLFNALIQFYLHIKNFNSSGSADNKDDKELY